MTFIDARNQCESDGAYLIRPRSQAENDWIFTIADFPYIWIGLDDIDEEGTFVTHDGSALTWTNWAENQPDSASSSEDAVHLHGGYMGQKWNDQNPGSRFQVICSYDISRTYNL